MRFKHYISNLKKIIPIIFWMILSLANDFSSFEFWIGMIFVYIILLLSDISQQIESVGRFLDASTIAGKWCPITQKYQKREK